MATKIKARKAKRYYDSIDTITSYVYHKVKETKDLSYLVLKGSVDAEVLVDVWGKINNEIVDYRCSNDDDFLDYWKKRKALLIKLANGVLKRRPADVFTANLELKAMDYGEAASYDEIKNTLQDIKGRHLNDKEMTMREWLAMLINIKNGKR